MREPVLLIPRTMMALEWQTELNGRAVANRPGGPGRLTDQGQPAVDRDAGPLAGKWTLLFPATYLVHFAEEAWAGETFPVWLSRVAGAHLTARGFAVLNIVALAAMSLGVFAANRVRRAEFAIVALGAIISVNAALHAGGAILTSSYSPGLVSGLGLWIPLGAFALRRAWIVLPTRRLVGGLILGFLAHGIVSAVAWRGHLW